MTERVTFRSQDIELTGILHRADGPRAIVLTGPFTGTRDQVTGVYAARLAAEGFTTLTFDHRGFGESGGRRGHEDSQGKLADLRAAVTLLDGYEVAAVGICLGGGYAMKAAATDPRITAVVGIAGAYNSPAWFADRMGLPAYRAALADMIRRYDETLPAVAPDGGEAAMPGDEPWSYYRTFLPTETERTPAAADRTQPGPGHADQRHVDLDQAGHNAADRHQTDGSRRRRDYVDHGRTDAEETSRAQADGVPADGAWPDQGGTGRGRTASGWVNQVTRGSLHSLMTLDVLGVRPLLPPSLIVHGRKDDYCSPELAEAMRADETVWLDCERHVDLYDAEPYVTEAVTATAEFLRRAPARTA
ncbi:alpha/beta hydrolase [Micromonosporaceae bacterium Da 78-11]